MGMLLQHMKTRISHYGYKSISHNMMQGHFLLTMRETNKVDPHRIHKLVTNAMWHPKD
jgi:hypothetical protein